MEHSHDQAHTRTVLFRRHRQRKRGNQVMAAYVPHYVWQCPAFRAAFAAMGAEKDWLDNHHGFYSWLMTWNEMRKK
jgi:hypothetical protein